MPLLRVVVGVVEGGEPLSEAIEGPDGRSVVGRGPEGGGERYIDLEGDVNCRILGVYKRWMLPFPDNHSQGNRRRRGSVLEVEVEMLLYCS